MAAMTKEHGHKVGFYSTLPHCLRNNFVNKHSLELWNKVI